MLFKPTLSIYIALFVVLFFAVGNTVQAQNKVTVQGSVQESATQQPIPFASVVVRSTATDNIITGGTTNEEGEFSLLTDLGDVYIEISFIGYKSATHHRVRSAVRPPPPGAG